ncbi:stage II sporulation protein M [Brachybacterium huguangmaarense]
MRPRAPAAYRARVDIDAFIAVNEPSWNRLAELVAVRRLTGDEIDELVMLYRRTATHLSTIRSTSPDPVLTARLSMLLARTRTRLTGGRPSLPQALRTFVLEDFPAAMHASRRGIAIAASILLVSWVASGLVLGLDDPLRAALMPEADQARMAETEFIGYYSEGAAGGFFAKVWTNNAWITAQVVVLGVTGFWPVLMLAMNGVNVGAAGAVMATHGRFGDYLLFLAPHGLLELTCVVVGAGAGLRLFWSWVRPGALPRTWALARAGRSLVTVAVGLVPVLLISGLLEAFVTPSSLPPAVRVGIGALVWAAFVAYAAVLGSRAHRRGITGDLSEEHAGAHVAVAA